MKNASLLVVAGGLLVRWVCVAAASARGSSALIQLDLQGHALRLHGAHLLLVQHLSVILLLHAHNLPLLVILLLHESCSLLGNLLVLNALHLLLLLDHVLLLHLHHQCVSLVVLEIGLLLGFLLHHLLSKHFAPFFTVLLLPSLVKSPLRLGHREGLIVSAVDHSLSPLAFLLVRKVPLLV